jgi:hypothetical protein
MSARETSIQQGIGNQLNIEAPHICKRNQNLYEGNYIAIIRKSVFETKFNQSTSIIIYIFFNLKGVSLITNQSHLKYLNLQAFIQLVTKQNEVNLPMLLSPNHPH